MLLEMSLLPSAIAEMTAHAAQTGVITVADRYALMAAIMSYPALGTEEREAVDRLLHAVCRGRIVLVNELSAIY